MKGQESKFTIDDVFVGMELRGIDNPSGRGVVLEKTNNSINVKIFKTGEKGIDCNGWFELSWFNRTWKNGTE